MNLIPTPNADHGRLLLLAPEKSVVPEIFTGVERNPQRHAALLASLQQLRGRVYLEDGAIKRSELSPDGRFVQPYDPDAWHLITLNGQDEVCGCARYLAYSGHLPFEQTGVSSSSLSASREWAARFRTAVESQMKLALRLGIDYVEVGGWALTPEVRRTSEALRIALGMFSLGRLLGGCIGLTTATMRHCSSSILRRLGGQPLANQGAEIPGYFDPAYRCDMEILCFESARPNPRFERWIEELKIHLTAVPVIHCDRRVSTLTAA